MYLPEHFSETSPDRIAALIADHSLGMLVTAPSGVPFASHLPFLFDQAAGPKGTLLAHMARANEQWQHLSAGSEVLVVFQGPHAYVSPTWYASTGVPTWNYAVVHLRGKARLIESGQELETLLKRLTQIHEAHQPSLWQPEQDEARRAQLLGMIVGCAIEVTQIQAKFKLSQNRPPADQRNVMAHLGASGNAAEAAVAQLMAEVLKNVE